MADSASLDELREMLAGLENSEAALSLYAMEAIALTALRAGELETARATAQAILDDARASPQLRLRMGEVLGHIDARLAAARANADGLAPSDLLLSDDTSETTENAPPENETPENPDAEQSAEPPTPDEGGPQQ